MDISVRAPTGVTAAAERLLADNVVPRLVDLMPGETLTAAARKACGRLTDTYLDLLATANRQKSDTRTAVIPACFVTRLDKTVRVVPGETWGDLATRSVGVSGPRTIGGIFASMEGIPDFGKPAWPQATFEIPEHIRTVTVPVATEAVSYQVKEGKDPKAVAAALTSALRPPAGINVAVTIDELKLQAGVPEGTVLKPVCPATPRPLTPWPFSVPDVAAVIARNEARLKAAGKTEIVVGIIDNGVDGLLGTAFPADEIKVSELELNQPGSIDPDGSDFDDDISGTNIYTGGEPVVYSGANNPGHGTMMASLALGGSDYRAWRRNAAATLHVKIKAVSIVRREVRPGPSGNVTSYALPTESLALAVNYAERMDVHILNLSVATSTRLSSVEEALYNRGNLLMVVAAGNEAANLDAVSLYPASLSRLDESYRGRVVTVAAHGKTGCLSGFSGRGPGTVDIAAPGEAIRATSLGGAETVDEGTSQATALVSFTAAQLRAAGMIGAPALKERLLVSVDPSPALYKQVRAEGTLNMVKALSVFDDVFERASASGLIAGKLAKPLTLGDVCPSLAADQRPLLKVSRRIDGGDPKEIRLVVRNRNSRSAIEVIHCQPVATPVQLIALDGMNVQIDWADVIDFVPAL